MSDLKKLEKEKSSQNIVLENREKLEITGVSNVNSFDELQITATTNLGFLTIKGAKLHIQEFNIKTKELRIVGKISDLKYSDNGGKQEHKNFLNRLFK